jgi:hypothetical protein
MTDLEEQQRRAAQAEWLRRAAEIAETLTDDEILSLGRRLRSTTAEWLRNVAKTFPDDPEHAQTLAAHWVMRLLLEERGHTFATNPNLQLGPRDQE